MFDEYVAYNVVILCPYTVIFTPDICAIRHDPMCYNPHNYIHVHYKDIAYASTNATNLCYYTLLHIAYYLFMLVARIISFGYIILLCLPSLIVNHNASFRRVITCHII